ncbi:Fasciclin-2 [Orchesella cincta]|uniref:Fasciclin-2 n=1 Tax=Orchesella cincta TaxID=48709 RepID=A0A1D2N0Y6_ORCCI|nr:Fasciclin-2 [Orchesella cincta]
MHKYKGTLQIDGIKREDAGVYTCTAKNTAGYVTMKSTLNVVTKPVMEEFKNITTQVNGNAILQCRASGDPAPDIRFHKDSNREPFSMGPQKDSRIVVDQRKQGRETTAILKISDVLRTDDGLYNCIAFNQRTKTELLGHITVEFPPTFANTPMKEAWSWDGRAANVTCLAEGIPNATIAWFIEGAPERPVDSGMANIKQIGFQSLSSLEVSPIDRSLYGFYKCVATNKLGTAEHRVQLKEARKPGPILEAIVSEKTATTITYKIVGPVDNGGLPVKSFVAQYKEDLATWEKEHKLKSWNVEQQLFTIENLEPMRTYFVRFAAENEVGLGNWALERPETTPRRSAPETPVILNEVNGVAITAYPDRFELIWRVPPDNGERITAFEISYVPVRNLTIQRGTQIEYEWDPVGQKLLETKPLSEPRHMLRNLAPGTYYRVEILAENSIGKSAPATIIIKTAAVPGERGV